MRRKYIYYRGDFSSQFSLPEEVKLKTKYSKGSKGKFFDLNIGEKKELNNSEQISEKEYNEFTRCGADPITCGCALHNNGKTFSYRFRKDSSLDISISEDQRPIQFQADEIILVLDRDANNFSLKEGDFYAAQKRYGKFSAIAFVRTFEEIPESKEEKKELIKKKQSKPKSADLLSPSKKKGCFGGRNASSPNFGTRLRNGIFGSSSSNTPGCFGNRGQMYGVPNSGVYGRRPGCFGSPSGPAGGGCFGGPGCFGRSMGPGCFSLGWLWQLLKWLLFLGLLLYLLSMLRTCDMNPQERVVYIHDTIQTVKFDTVNVIEETKITSTDKIALPNVQFKTDSDVLVKGSKNDIENLASFMTRNDSVSAHIMGHTDDVGDSLHNFQLSEARALAVKNELIKLGISENRITTEGFGENAPKAVDTKNPSEPDKTEEGRLMNRRVEVQLENMGTTTTTETSETLR